MVKEYSEEVRDVLKTTVETNNLIRAYNAVEYFEWKFQYLLSNSLQCKYSSFSLDDWMYFRMEILTAILKYYTFLLFVSYVSVLVALFYISNGTMSSLNAGVCAMVLYISTLLINFVHQTGSALKHHYSNLEAIESFLHDLEVPSELSLKSTQQSAKVPNLNWPRHGGICVIILNLHLSVVEFRNVKTILGPTVSVSLNAVSFSVLSYQKVGILLSHPLCGYF